MACKRPGVQIPLAPLVRCLGTPCTGVLGHRSRFGLGLVVPGGVEFEVAEDFAVRGGDADLAILDEDEDGFAGVAAADSDVVEPAVVAEGELPAAVDGVVADAPAVVVEFGAGRECFGAGLVGLGGGVAAEGPVGVPPVSRTGWV